MLNLYFFVVLNSIIHEKIITISAIITVNNIQHNP